MSVTSAPPDADSASQEEPDRIDNTVNGDHDAFSSPHSSTPSTPLSNVPSIYDDDDDDLNPFHDRDAFTKNSITKSENIRKVHTVAGGAEAKIQPEEITRAVITPQDTDTGSSTPTAYPHKGLKRKRGASPPWQFPTVELSTIKGADGRRISARFNSATPVHSESDAPTIKKGQVTPRIKPISPPWKKFAADGPASIEVDGKRKSGRVHSERANREPPTRVSPRGQKEAVENVVQSGKTGRPRGRPPKNPRTGGSLSTAHAPEQGETPIPKRKPGRPRRVNSLEDQHEPLPTPTTPTKASRHEGRRTQGEIQRSTRDQPSRSSANVAQPKVKLRINFSRHQLPPPHPLAIPPRPSRPPQPSLIQVLEEVELRELQHPHMENERGPPDAAFFTSRNEKQAVEEASVRQRLLNATESGGPLSRDTAKFYLDDSQPEPPQQYGHYDHIVYQALYFRSLQQREKIQHKALAKKVAQEALEFWKAKRGPTEEEIRAEEDKIFRLIYKQVITDMRAKWDMVFAYVQQLRKEQWEAVEDAKRQERLQKQLEWSEKQIARQRGELSDSDMDDDSDAGTQSDEDVTDSGDEAESSEDENMSESSSELEAEENDEQDNKGPELAGDALAAYLKFRQNDPPDKSHDRGEQADDVSVLRPQDDDVESEDDRGDGDNQNISMLLADGSIAADTDSDSGDFEPADAHSSEGDDDGDDEGESDDDEGNAHDNAQQPDETSLKPTRGRNVLQDAAHTVLDADDVDLSSDHSVEMYDSDDDMEESGMDESSEDEDEDDPEATGDPADKSLLGFLFSSKELKGIGLPTPTTSAGGEDRDHTIEDAVGAESHASARPESSTTSAMRNSHHGTSTPQSHGAETVSDGHDMDLDKHHQAEDPDNEATGLEDQSDDVIKPMVAIPSLLRGILRSYQHAGLDWLASLYRNGTNGILADEMGLGKTIQTISLMAHLAEHYGVWETHLVIVPTSVILNWVTEFQKFLPGFRVLGYYGSTEERAVKRRCWANDPHHNDRAKRGYNVVITSYNVAMQDINAIRVVGWHYLVLDEAHNIRNFNSQRWQVLIRLRTKARLLLTGTPLQNSLVELWSLLTFLTAGDDDPAHGDLEDFLSHWKEPVKEIFERGVSALSSEAQKVVDQLHISLRPFLLRRLKSEVEKDLPKKTEKVVVCKLSKRQRQLYQEYMGLAATRESLSRGNAVSAGRVLLSLRRVCNHPDLFDPRPTQTSFAMESTPLDKFTSVEMLVRRMMGLPKQPPPHMQLARVEHKRKYIVRRTRQISGTRAMEKQVMELQKRIVPEADPSTPAGCQVLQNLHQRNMKLERVRNSISATKRGLRDLPIYGLDLRELLTVHKPTPYRITRPAKPAPYHFWRGYLPFSSRPIQVDHLSDWHLAQDSRIQREIATVTTYAERLHDDIVRFTFCTPSVTAPILDHAIPRRAQDVIRWSDVYPREHDFAHEARMRTSIVFPDKRLLVYDSGKLQRLTLLLRDLQARQSRSLIFTQMTGTLNILEQFLSLMNLPYLRLDGSTPVEKRQLYSAEFNRPDSKYQCMILSSRAGGVGLNLVGASSVIFYDLDWNPQMDRQCMDRAHRIGQVRDVEVYKMVSEKTVEENVLRRANQKSLLDQTVIQEGHFTTEYQQPSRENGSLLSREEDEGDEDVAAAIERFLGGGEKASTQALESVEDREDVQAAQQARREENQDEADFADRSSKGAASATATPGPGGVDIADANANVGGDVHEKGGVGAGHVDSYMIQSVQRALEGVPYVPPVVRRLDKTGRDPSHRPKKRR